MSPAVNISRRCSFPSFRFTSSFRRTVEGGGSHLEAGKQPRDIRNIVSSARKERGEQKKNEKRIHSLRDVHVELPNRNNVNTL